MRFLGFDKDCTWFLIVNSCLQDLGGVYRRMSDANRLWDYII